MATRKRAGSSTASPRRKVDEPATPAAVDSEAPAAAPSPDGGAAAESTPPAPRPVPPHPIKRFRIAGRPPTRAGGYVLTERGWVRDTEQES